MKFLKYLRIGFYIVPVTCLVTVAFTSPARADYKIATVDINRILNESKEAQTRRKELEQKSSTARKKIESQGKALQEREKKLKAENIAENSKEVGQFRSDAKEFNRLVNDTEEDLKREFLKFNRELADKTVKVVGNYAEKHGLNLVLDKSEKGRGPVLFGDDSYDITDSIISTMNE